MIIQVINCQYVTDSLPARHRLPMRRSFLFLPCLANEDRFNYTYIGFETQGLGGIWI